MKKQQIVFNKIKELLSKQFGDELKEFEDGTHLTIGKTGIWISVDEIELTIGYDINHRHFNPEYDDINEAIHFFFNLLTRKKRITSYFKGSKLYKTKAEVEMADGKYSVLSTSTFLTLKFWKKTTEQISIEEKIIDYSVIKIEVMEIKRIAL